MSCVLSFLRKLASCLLFAFLLFTAGAGAQHMSTRSFTNAGVGSDPGSLTKAGNTISVDLSAIVGATVYRATLDPYVKPHQSRDRYVIRDGNGKVLKLLAPRYLGFDATEAVKSSMSSGRLVLTVEDPGQGFGSVISLDVLCDAPAPVPITQVDQAAARFQDGDTMITFAEVNPPHTQPEWTVGDYDDAMEAAGPDRSPKRRYRIYRSTSPFDDPADLAGAELVDEIMPLTGWNGRLHAYDPTGNHEKDVLEIPTLPVSDLTLAAPGTGIYVKRFEGAAPETAYYLVSHTLNGAEDFSSLVEGKNATGPVSETDGPGMTLLWQSEYIKGKWYWKPYIHMTLYYYVRWAAMPDWNVPNHAFNYRLGKSHDHVPAAPPLEISPHAWNGSLLGYYDWSWYTKGAMLLTFNLLYYNSYTAFHECAGTLRSYDDGTVQPFMHARVLDFIHNFAQPTYNIDMNRVIMTGGSMGGEAGNFWGMRSGHLLAYIDSSVGNTIPSEYITWEFESIGEWGPISWQSIYSNPQVVRFGYPEIKPSDNYVVWDYFHNPLWLKAHRGLDTPYITYANAPNDGGWEQAWKTTQAMMETKRPFNFTWGQNGHGQWTEPLGLDYTLKQSLPAFGRCSLDDDLGTNPNNCALEGHINRYLLWDVNTIVDESDRWEMDIHLANYAHQTPVHRGRDSAKAPEARARSGHDLYLDSRGRRRAAGYGRGPCR